MHPPFHPFYSTLPTSLILLTSLIPPFPTVSLSDLAAAASLISLVNGVPSSLQTNSWINRWVQTLSSLFIAEMVENSNVKRPRGREAERERQRWKRWSRCQTSEMLLTYFKYKYNYKAWTTISDETWAKGQKYKAGEFGCSESQTIAYLKLHCVLFWVDS